MVLRRHAGPLLVALLVLSVACTSASERKASIGTPGWGALSFTLPNGWRVHDVPQSPLTLKLVPEAGKTFEVTILPFTSPQSGVPPSTPESLKAQALANRAYLSRYAIEANIEIRDFKVGSAFGSFFSFTDRSPKPGGFSHLTYGLAQTAGWPVAFEIHSDTTSVPLVETTLQLLQSARKE